MDKSYINLNYGLQKLKQCLKYTPAGANSVQFLNIHAEGLTHKLNTADCGLHTGS
jgi:hypothetical protein